MPIFNLFSKRQSDAAKAGQSDVYRYDFVPSKFRVQLLNLAQKSFGQDRHYRQGIGHVSNPNWVWIDETYCHEKGINPLGGNEHMPNQIREAFKKLNNEDALDMVELIIFRISKTEQLSNPYQKKHDISDKKVDEVNYRLREAGMGYQFENGQLSRVDSQFIHSEAVKPALTLLSRPGYEGVQEEFLNAHSHYRAGKSKEAVAMAANALESTFKAIFDKKGWAYNKGSRISDLMKIARTNNLWPNYLDNSFDQLAATLQSGLPKIRDNDASHGQGPTPKDVPDYLAAYALHLAASKIVLLVSAADYTN
ncbi:STM4504/CBY_0614 family protein [Novosphingobium sp. AAP1]|uniref:STM4504/CBY_0614 family protein n=1 Tax=Novosphingobium sp. AAP1 TaxID=1523413 RepID=UPI000A5F8E87|nr:hypothetical protein [Novosphingobium sp. AAP1]